MLTWQGSKAEIDQGGFELTHEIARDPWAIVALLLLWVSIPFLWAAIPLVRLALYLSPSVKSRTRLRREQPFILHH
jgi:hypothetical protein